MPKAIQYSEDGQVKTEVDLPNEIFGMQVRSHHLWRGVTTYLSNQRLGTLKAKTKGEVSGGGKKPFRQKGTGNARQGSIRAVQMVGGGVSHGPIPRDFSMALPKKMKQQALCESLSDKASSGKVILVEKLQFASPKTKEAVSFLKRLGLENQKVLIVLKASDLPTMKSFKNLFRVTVIPKNNLSIFLVLKHEVVLFAKEAVAELNFFKEAIQ
jgi:large subunit ribosomal protein L4